MVYRTHTELCDRIYNYYVKEGWIAQGAELPLETVLHLLKREQKLSEKDEAYIVKRRRYKNDGMDFQPKYGIKRIHDILFPELKIGYRG